MTYLGNGIQFLYILKLDVQFYTHSNFMPDCSCIFVCVNNDYFVLEPFYIWSLNSKKYENMIHDVTHIRKNLMIVELSKTGSDVMELLLFLGIPCNVCISL